MALISEKKGDKYYSFSNSDGKKWSIPLKNTKLSLLLYEPSATKGKILKRFFNVASKFRALKLFLNGQYVDIECSELLLNLLREKFGSNLEFSIFWGTPSVDQKITMQIFKKDKILGYCKIGYSDRTKRLFKHEKEILDFLEQKHLKNVPRCLCSKKIEHANIFVQDTLKELKSTIMSSYNDVHSRFLNELYKKTYCEVLFEDTDFYKELLFLKDNINDIKKIDQRCRVNHFLEDFICQYKGKFVNWGLVHRDFTPWNTCCVNGDLYVFDFEYALFNAPSCIDKCHFLCQKFCFENDTDSLSQLKRISHNELMIYLLSYVSMYLKRGSVEDVSEANNRIEILLDVMDGVI